MSLSSDIIFMLFYFQNIPCMNGKTTQESSPDTNVQVQTSGRVDVAASSLASSS